MTNLILLFSIVLILCVLSYKFFSKFGIPMLLIFIGLGLLFGESGIFKIKFDDYNLSQMLCSFALIFIIFYGGFGTKLKMAKGIITKSLLLSTLGVFLTAFLTAFFCRYFLKFSWQLSLLIGSVISSTDAATVFSILRSHNLNLKYKTAPLLEIESGSNDPFAYVLTVAFLSGVGNISFLLFKQVTIALIIGFILPKITKYLMNKVKNIDISFSMAFLMGMVMFAFSLTEFLGGNGYIAVYLYGILIGDIKFNKKNEIVSFFNGLTSIMQMVIFFLLGLLASPMKAVSYLHYSILIMLILTFIVRPLVIYVLLKPFKAPLNQITLVSFAGLRGVASVVFSLYCITVNETLGYIVFNISFIIVLLSISFQGSLLPYIAKKLDMIDENGSVLKTFNDYADEEDVEFISFDIVKNHEWINKKISQIKLMPSVLLVLIIRDNQNIIPNGETILKENDRVVLCGSSFVDVKRKISLMETKVDKFSKYVDKYVYQLKDDFLIVMIKRNEQILIPTGKSQIKEDDTLVLLDKSVL